MITCCELALWIALSSLAVILSLLAMFFNYTLKLKDRQIFLEKKNGSEQMQIDELKKELQEIKSSKKTND